MGKHSNVKIRGINQPKTVRITSESKPDIEPTIIEKWQSLIDTIAKIVEVPSGLIMRLNEDNIEVFLKSNTKGNPYHKGEKAELVYALYCETVIGTQKELLVPDATKDELWSKNNPDIDLNMISYLGLPINWPDGECFGTVCLLDSKENHYTQNFKDFLEQVKRLIETDLQLQLKSNDLAKQNEELDHLNLIKTKFLSLISHDVRGSLGSAKMFLDLLVTDLDKFDKTDLLPLLKNMSDNISSSYDTLEDLLTWAKNELVKIEPIFERVNMVGLIEEILTTMYNSIHVKELELIKDYLSEEVYLSVDYKMMKVVLRNILSNAVKYSNKNGKIVVRLLRKEKQHIIEIEDTGIGMSQSAVNKLFSYDINHPNQGTAGESSAGIGLMLVREFIDKNNAEINIASELGKGTIVSITI